ncbi:MAG: class I tRNA ligase family protein, partial [Planctomycetota bacterium]
MSSATPIEPSAPAGASEFQLAKAYTPADAERYAWERWQGGACFHAEPGDAGAPYSIFIPPPNVTAALHLGHALNNTLQDVLTRFHRMRGMNAMWMPGTDHAGIATQTVVEKRLLQQGKRRADFSRTEFVAKVQEWKDEYEATILGQLRAMGASCDYDRTRFTMDPVCAAAVRHAFLRLFDEGLIYRGKRLVNWDPVTRTEFVAKVQEWKDEYEATILSQLRAMGCSCDYDRVRFTMDPVCAAAVREAFFRLFSDGLI